MNNFASNSLLDSCIAIARKAGDYVLSESQKGLVVEHKGRIDLVTQVDKGSQDIIVSEIERLFPGHAILAEEDDFNKITESEYVWIIDPIDGTTNFVHGLPIFCVSVALYRDKKPHLGVCFNPAMGDCFWASEGQGAFRNGKSIFVSQTDAMINALLTTGFAYQNTTNEMTLQRFIRILGQAQGVRRFGSAALDLCYVACGQFDAFWEENLKPWDMAAGVLILKEAGGRLSLFDGSDYDLYNGNIVASNSLLHKELLRLL